MTHVPAILELAEILPKVLLTDVDVGAVDAALQHRPEALNPVHCASCWADILEVAVGDALLPIAACMKVLIRGNEVSVVGRSR